MLESGAKHRLNVDLPHVDSVSRALRNAAEESALLHFKFYIYLT